MSQVINRLAPLLALTPADGFVQVGGGLEREKAGRELRATETDTKESTRQTQTETKRRKFSSL